MSAALILRNNNVYFACSVSAKDERRKSDREKLVKKADYKLEVIFYVNQYRDTFYDKPQNAEQPN